MTDLSDNFRQPEKVEIDVVNKNGDGRAVMFNGKVVPARMTETFVLPYRADTDNHVPVKEDTEPGVSTKMFKFQMDEELPTATVQFVSPADKQFVFGKSDEVRNSQGKDLITVTYQGERYKLVRELDSGTKTVKLTLTLGP